MPTTDPRLQGKRSFIDRLLGVGRPHPVLDLLLYLPALLGGAVAIIAIGANVSWPARSSGFAALILVLSSAGAFLGAALAVGLLWFAWAGVVRLVSLAWNVSRSVVRLRAAPLPSQIHSLRIWNVPAPKPLTLISLRHLTSPGNRWYLARAAQRVALSVASLRERVREAVGEGLERLKPGRDHVIGTARSDGETELVAPISGKRCIAFRIRGRAGDQLLDDAGVSPLVIGSSAGSVVLRARALVVALSPFGVETRDLDVEQRTRLGRFYSERGLELDLDDVQLGESVLSVGDEVEAWGALSREPAESDYRSSAERKVLGDGDEKPVVVTITVRRATASVFQPR